MLNGAANPVIAQWDAIAAAGGSDRLERLFARPGQQHSAIRQAIAWLRPESVLEIGCSVGVNLAAAAELGVPRLCGIDIDRGALAYAADRIDATFLSGDLRRLLPMINPKTWDVSISCYALAYVHPDEIESTLQALVDCTRRAVILAEPREAMGTPQSWAHDYVTLGRRLGLRQCAMHVIEPVDGLDMVSIWEVARA